MVASTFPPVSRKIRRAFSSVVCALFCGLCICMCARAHVCEGWIVGLRVKGSSLIFFRMVLIVGCGVAFCEQENSDSVAEDLLEAALQNLLPSAKVSSTLTYFVGIGILQLFFPNFYMIHVLYVSMTSISHTNFMFSFSNGCCIIETKPSGIFTCPQLF